MITVFIILHDRSMYVCICRAVTEDMVKQAIDEGADSVDAVTARTCAGDDCGSCHGMIEDLIEARLGRRATPSKRLPVVKAA